jgi:UDP-N-acetylglucosamine 2-epimerase (non-hydrolysing)
MNGGGSERIRILAVAGARPNFIKIAPLLQELRSRDRFQVSLVHLGIQEPDENLGVGSATHGEQTAQVLSKLEALMLERRPDAVVVGGDVNSTLAAALAAVKLRIPVAHVEAGLRSFDRDMPEEINRLLTDAISDWLFTTEQAGDENLLREGVPAERIHRVGNVMIDTLLANLERARKLDTLERLELSPRGYGVLTLHRPSNVDDPARLLQLFSVLEEIHARIPIVFPVHPRTAAAIQEQLGGAAPALRLTEPMGYLDFLRLMADARLVLTDSGGIQEETTVLGVTCLTLRENTERPVTVTEGTNIIVGSDPATIRAEAWKVLEGGGKSGRVPELWDGGAARRIVDVLERDLGGTG